jgi:glycosyltransferase family protein
MRKLLFYSVRIIKTVTLFYFFKKKNKFPKIMTIEETLDLIINSNVSVARFGDGEINLLSPEHAIGFQQGSIQLSEKLKEVLLSDNPLCIICIPSTIYTLENVRFLSKITWKNLIMEFYPKVKPYLNLFKKYPNTLVTRPYIDWIDRNKKAKERFDKLKQIWLKKDILIIEGEFTKLGVNNDLFDNAKSIKRIITLNKNSFSKYNDIFQYVIEEVDRNYLILIALGPTATILAYDLSKKGYRAIDVGHIDIEYEWFLHRAKKKIPIKHKYVNELLSGQSPENIENKEYQNQIIATIL